MIKLKSILPDLIKELITQTLSSIMLAERDVFVKEHGG